MEISNERPSAGAIAARDYVKCVSGISHRAAAAEESEVRACLRILASDVPRFIARLEASERSVITMPEPGDEPFNASPADMLEAWPADGSAR